MDGWMERYGCIEGWADELMDEYINEMVTCWMKDRLIDGWIEGYRWMDGWTDELID